MLSVLCPYQVFALPVSSLRSARITSQVVPISLNFPALATKCLCDNYIKEHEMDTMCHARGRGENFTRNVMQNFEGKTLFGRRTRRLEDNIKVIYKQVVRVLAG